MQLSPQDFPSGHAGCACKTRGPPPGGVGSGAGGSESSTGAGSGVGKLEELGPVRFSLCKAEASEQIRHLDIIAGSAWHETPRAPVSAVARQMCNVTWQNAL